MWLVKIDVVPQKLWFACDTVNLKGDEHILFNFEI